MEKLWGDNFFDPATKKWTKKNTGTATCKRGFVQFVYDPIKTVVEACMNDNRTKLYNLIEKLGVTLKSEQKELSGKALMKATLQNWIPAHEVYCTASLLILVYTKGFKTCFMVFALELQRALNQKRVAFLCEETQCALFKRQPFFLLTFFLFFKCCLTLQSLRG